MLLYTNVYILFIEKEKEIKPVCPLQDKTNFIGDNRIATSWVQSRAI